MDFREGKFQSPREAEWVTKIRKSAIARRLKGGKPCNKARKERQNLTRAEEAESVR